MSLRWHKSSKRGCWPKQGGATQAEGVHVAAVREALRRRGALRLWQTVGVR